MYWRSRGKFSAVGSNGNSDGSVGVQGKSVESAMPELEQVEAAKVLKGLQVPWAGKSDGICPKSTHGSQEMKVYGTVLETYANCRE